MQNISRRNFLRISGLGAVALAAPFAFTGCGGGGGGREKELNILCWEGYNSAQVLDPFRARFGAKVQAESLTNDPTMINRLRGGEIKIWDLINVNNPWARNLMLPENLIKPLPLDVFEPCFATMGAGFKFPYPWAMSGDGRELIGMPQRYGPHNFVVNTKKISKATAEDEGWELFNDPRLAGRYGILEQDDWNVFDVFIIAGINPFAAHSEAELQKFTETAKRLYAGARMVGDIAALNQALINGEIDAHFPGGTYTVSPARADGYPELRAITPRKGPFNGRGGVSWIEITSVVNNPGLSPLALEFLKYVQEPDAAHRVAFAEGTFNAVAQMGNPECFKLFTKSELDAIQWDTMEEDMANCIEYNIVPDYDRALALMNAAKRVKG